jgi:predicted nucleotidyltransferase component of viral defense system
MLGAALTPAQTTHVALMGTLARGFADLPMVLKGGTALLLCYGLDRFSEDLDFDAPKRFNVAARIERLLQGVATHQEIRTVKDTETVQRLKVHYQAKNGVERLLKIETSFRHPPLPSDVHQHEGIRVYVLPRLIEQKLLALVQRTTARDLYDVAFLAHAHLSAFSPAAWQTFSAAARDINMLESRFLPAFEDDAILNAEQLPGLLLQLQDALESRR